jgi:hypothetical protein
MKSGRETLGNLQLLAHLPPEVPGELRSSIRDDEVRQLVVGNHPLNELLSYHLCIYRGEGDKN